MNPIYERLSVLCKERHTSITALCLEVTGSKGNLATWKKGKIYAEDLATIREKLGISIDEILTENVKEDTYEKRIAQIFARLDDETKREVYEEVVRLLESKGMNADERVEK